MPEPGRRRTGLLPRTVRGRTTAALVFLTMVAVTVSAAVLLFFVHAGLAGSARQAADRQLRVAERELRQGASVETVRHDAPDVSLSLVPEGQVVPGPSARPTPAGPNSGRVTVRTDTGVYTIEADPRLTSTRTVIGSIAWALVLAAVLQLVFMAGLIWYALGRVLRPVESLRTEFAKITAGRLDHRVPVRSSDDEVALLAATMNTGLDQLQRAVNRLETFTSDASHELRGPLTTLRARLEIARMLPEQTDWPDIVDESLADVTRLEEIVHDLLFLARLDAHQPLKGEPIPFTEFVRDVIGDLYADQPVSLIAAAPVPDRPDTVFGGPSSLTRALKNLIDNGLAHAAGDVQVEVLVGDDQVVVEVRDDGPGIPEEARERVFDRFVRLDDARTARSGGSGLGLAIARDVCVAHGGSLFAREPLPGRTGARLVLALPTADPVSRTGQEIIAGQDEQAPPQQSGGATGNR
ncbi:sensor histidine kinase [Streptomyces fuscichromogenes]|uniref:histidine kinase n=1 Tax=Streptomyces fuscichromogenes TaxID=1324013 RepID=A0A918CVI3_9ACTN|nr:HAMP domain-containing sensor histidine kinase [Streptomyces fuscichromogenes]GGN35139.1 two-component sensor histidine kinase [Streptomyces fuscichromogenes]